MLKRDELANPNSCLNRARDDEMTFVLLGRDIAAAAAVRFWVEERIRLGKNSRDDKQIVKALDDANACAKPQPPASGTEPRCVNCGKPATCFGSYEGHEPAYGCDECCGHGNEDGWCNPVAVQGTEPRATEAGDGAVNQSQKGCQMRVRIFSDNSAQTVGEIEKFTIGNDGPWVHLKDCDPGPSLQVFCLDYITTIRPEESLQFAACFSPDFTVHASEPRGCPTLEVES